LIIEHCLELPCAGQAGVADQSVLAGRGCVQGVADGGE
jgi:hypothetical protein